MLSSEHALVSFKDGMAQPDRLTRRSHGHYLEYARRMLELYRTGTGKTRRELHRAIFELLLEEPDCPLRRIHAFCKLLDDISIYDADKGGRAAKLRMQVFTAAAPHHPLVQNGDRLFERNEFEIKTQIAAELGQSWSEIEDLLYADVFELQRLKRFDEYANPVELLSRYNVAQIQACLYRAESMMLNVRGDLKQVLRHVKLAQLMHEIWRTGADTYRLQLTGPCSVLRETRRYGVNMAQFFANLLHCRDWALQANLWTPWKQHAILQICSADGFSPITKEPERYDSEVEAAFAEKFGEEREGWRLQREGVLLHRNQNTFLPDFSFRHRDGAEVLLEIVGFWTPEYLAHKRETLRRFAEHRILLAVCSRLIEDNVRIPENCIVYKSRLQIAPVLEKLEALRCKIDSGRS